MVVSGPLSPDLLPQTPNYPTHDTNMLPAGGKLRAPYRIKLEKRKKKNISRLLFHPLLLFLTRQKIYPSIQSFY